MTDFGQSLSYKTNTSLFHKWIQVIKGKLVHQKNTQKISRKFWRTSLVIIGVIILIIGARSLVLRIKAKPAVMSNSVSTVADPLTVPIEREFSFKVYDKDKTLSDPVRYVITTVQLTKQIVIKGQKATAVSGRAFLILNLKLVNEFDKSLFLNTRNYVRIQPNGSQDKLAPEIHNDTVEVQPLSTKLTRIGMPVSETDKKFTLHVGELEGEKQQIEINFP